MKSKIFAGLFFFLPFLNHAQDAAIFPPDSIKKKAVAHKIEGSLKIDGHLEEPFWQLAPVAGDFTEIEPLQGTIPEHPTEFKILYNKQFLYFGIFAKDSQGSEVIRATDFRRDFNTRQHDHISIAIDGFQDGRNAMVLATNAFGVQRDLLTSDDIFTDLDWDGLWRVRTSRTDSGWVTEMAIPWQTLRYKKTQTATQDWGFNITRSRRATNELSAFSPYPRILSQTRMEYAGVIQGLEPPPPSANIRIQPYTLYSYDRFRDGNTRSISTFKPGGDIKWAINSHTVLDLTVNTDFAQADVDRQVNNVTRFSVFFPERRQFFLENASLFGFFVGQQPDLSGGSMRIQPFFSRSIGLDPLGRPIPIHAGARVVHRSAQQNIGLMAIRQGDPNTDFFIGRYSRNFGAQNRVGGLFTVKNSPEEAVLVSAVDGFFRLSEKHSLNTLVTHSTQSQSGQQGVAAMAQYFYTTNNWKIWVTNSLVTKDYNPELGFVSRKDVLSINPGIFWYYRGKYLSPFKKIIRAFEPSILPEFYWEASTGRLLETQWWIVPIWLNFQKGGHFGYAVNPYYQFLNEPFRPLGIEIPAGNYRYQRHQIYFATDPSKFLSLNTNIEWGGYFDGKLTSYDVRVLFAPSPHFSFTGRMNRNDFIGKRTIDLYSLEGRLAINPRLQLIGFYQQNSGNNAKNYNIRLAWEYLPLSFVYIVYNSTAFSDQLYSQRSEDHAIVKFSLLRQL